MVLTVHITPIRTIGGLKMMQDNKFTPIICIKILLYLFFKEMEYYRCSESQKDFI